MSTPEFDVFKTPNVDTLYSNAWLDLTQGPALIRIPPIRSRYYTLHFLDAHSNATNLSSVGEGDFVVVSPQAAESDWRSFFRCLDFSLRANGQPLHEDAYVNRFRSIGLGGAQPLDVDALDDATQQGLEAGFAEAMELIRSARSEFADPVGETGWISGSAGEDGFNYLRRAIRNFIGTGGNVIAEKVFFATHNTASGEPLDASKARYAVTLDPPPPVDGHWSLTIYPTATGLLYPNELGRYAVAATTPGLEYGADGSLTVLMQHERPDNAANWLPAPEGEFYLDLRTWEPRAEVRDGTWRPGPVTPVG